MTYVRNVDWDSEIVDRFNFFRKELPEISVQSAALLTHAAVLSRVSLEAGDTFGHEICLAIKMAMRDESWSVHNSITKE